MYVCVHRHISIRNKNKVKLVPRKSSSAGVGVVVAIVVVCFVNFVFSFSNIRKMTNCFHILLMNCLLNTGPWERLWEGKENLRGAGRESLQQQWS